MFLFLGNSEKNIFHAVFTPQRPQSIFCSKQIPQSYGYILPVLKGPLPNMVNNKGLEWVQEMFGLEPRWTTEPAIEIVEKLARTHLSLDQDKYCEVVFHTQGAFNKLYKVNTENGLFMMRVTLPVDPCHKTESEVATIKFVNQKTDIPVPKIIASDASNENELGFEWILMEMVPGKPLRAHWRKLPMSAKRDLVQRIALYQAQLFRNQFTGIGNIFEQELSEIHSTANNKQVSPAEHGEANFVVDRIVSLKFFWGDHITQDVPRGPFANSYDWLRTLLTFVFNDQERLIKESDDEDEIEDAQTAQDLAERLLGHLPQIVPPPASSDDRIVSSENSVLFHDDLSMQNILVTEHGQISAVIDWECVSALPLWRICQIPAFLQGRERDEEPHRDQYLADDPESYIPEPDEDQDNEGINPLYWEHLLEYEQTILRRTFMAKMEELEPCWVEESRKPESALKADFERAVHQCDNDFTFKIIREWLDSIRVGEEIWSLRGRFLQ